MKFAVFWRKKMWSEQYDHQYPVHNPPSKQELQTLREGWAAAHLQYKKGHNLEKAGKRHQAVEFYRKAIDLYSGHSMALERLGILTYDGLTNDDKSPDWDDAARLLRRALTLDPTMYAAALFLGMTLHKLGKRDEARRMFERAISLDPYGDLAKTSYAEHLGYCGEYNKAEDLFKRILKKNPESGIALRFYAHMLMYKTEEINVEDTRRAIALLEKALKNDLGYACHYLLAIAHSWLDNNEAAVWHLRKVTRLKPGYKNTNELLAELESDGDKS